MNDTTQEATFADEVAAQVNTCTAPTEAQQAEFLETGKVLTEEQIAAKKAAEWTVKAPEAPVEA